MHCTIRISIEASYEDLYLKLHCLSMMLLLYEIINPMFNQIVI